MKILLSRTRCIALLILVLAGSVAMLHPHLAITVLAGCVLGAIMALTANSIVVAAVLFCPIALFAWAASAWQGPALQAVSASAGDDLLSTLIGTMLGGAVVCSLIPYAAARWTGVGLIGSIVAWFCGLLIIAGIVSSGWKYITISPHQMQNYSMWLVFNGLLPSTASFQYQGQARLDTCVGVISRHSDLFTIPADVRKHAEEYTNTPLPDFLKRYYASDDYDVDPRIPCSATITDKPDGSVEVQNTCAPVQGLIALANKSPDQFQAFQLAIPTITIQGPLLVPAPESVLVVTAPRGCIADTYPAAQQVSHDDQVETLQIKVGFPRSTFSLFEAYRIFSEPWFIQINLMKQSLRGVFWQTVLRTLLSRPGMIAMFVLAAAGTLGALRGDFRLWPSRGVEPSLTDKLGTKIATAPVQAFRRVRAFIAERGRVVRWLIIGCLSIAGALFAAVLVAAMILLWLASYFEPALSGIGPEFFGAIALIEIVRWAGRRLVPPRAPS